MSIEVQPLKLIYTYCCSTDHFIHNVVEFRLILWLSINLRWGLREGATGPKAPLPPHKSAPENKVWPIKSQTTPRLELCGALILARLLLFCANTLNFLAMWSFAGLIAQLCWVGYMAAYAVIKTSSAIESLRLWRCFHQTIGITCREHKTHLIAHQEVHVCSPEN